jgi:2-dehydro-3-deoxyphosphogluconate aldolase/(4S)-4-hydroxy-2-oxoglutarate aldolase
MNSNALVSALRTQQVLPLFRQESAEVKQILNQLQPLNIRVIELTTSIPSWQVLVEELSRDYIVGVGTIKSESHIRQAKAAGAQFLVSFGFFDALLEEADIPVIPGAMTPNELMTIQRAGVRCAKIYPASVLGKKYISDLKKLMPEMELMVTGGISSSKDEINSWIASGAFCVGVGSNVTSLL